MDDSKHLARALTEFIAQAEAPCLLLMLTDQDTLYPAKMLSSMDREDSDTVYLVYTQPCPDATSYMDAIADSARTHVQWLNTALVADDVKTIDPVPDEVLDPRQPPAQRLTRLVDYVRAQLGDDATIVWALLPHKLDDVDGFREMTRPLVPTEGVPAWTDGHRFIVRDQLDGGIWAKRLHEDEIEDALVYRFEMSPERAADDLATLTADPSRTDDERMGALLQLAGLDVGHQRYPEAIEKYDALQEYYGATNNPNLRALALGGSGDALRFSERPVDALDRYRQGLAIGVAAQEWSATLTLLTRAGSTCLELEDWAEAEGYFGLATTVADKLLNATALCDSHEQQGIARDAQGKHKEAAQSWISAKDLSTRYGYRERFTSSIDRLIALYEQADLPEKVEALRLEKAAGIGLPAGDGDDDDDDDGDAGDDDDDAGDDDPTENLA